MRRLIKSLPLIGRMASSGRRGRFLPTNVSKFHSKNGGVKFIPSFLIFISIVYIVIILGLADGVPSIVSILHAIGITSIITFLISSVFGILLALKNSVTFPETFDNYLNSLILKIGESVINFNTKVNSLTNPSALRDNTLDLTGESTKPISDKFPIKSTNESSLLERFTNWLHRDDNLGSRLDQSLNGPNSSFEVVTNYVEQSSFSKAADKIANGYDSVKNFAESQNYETSSFFGKMSRLAWHAIPSWERLEYVVPTVIGFMVVSATIAYSWGTLKAWKSSLGNWWTSTPEVQVSSLQSKVDLICFWRWDLWGNIYNNINPFSWNWSLLNPFTVVSNVTNAINPLNWSWVQSVRQLEFGFKKSNPSGDKTPSEESDDDSVYPLGTDYNTPDVGSSRPIPPNSVDTISPTDRISKIASKKKAIKDMASSSTDPGYHPNPSDISLLTALSGLIDYRPFGLFRALPNLAGNALSISAAARDRALKNITTEWRFDGLKQEWVATYNPNILTDDVKIDASIKPRTMDVFDYDTILSGDPRGRNLTGRFNEYLQTLGILRSPVKDPILFIDQQIPYVENNLYNNIETFIIKHTTPLGKLPKGWVMPEKLSRMDDDSIIRNMLMRPINSKVQPELISLSKWIENNSHSSGNDRLDRIFLEQSRLNEPSSDAMIFGKFLSVIKYSTKDKENLLELIDYVILTDVELNIIIKNRGWDEYLLYIDNLSNTLYTHKEALEKIHQEALIKGLLDDKLESIEESMKSYGVKGKEPIEDTFGTEEANERAYEKSKLEELSNFKIKSNHSSSEIESALNIIANTFVENNLKNEILKISQDSISSMETTPELINTLKTLYISRPHNALPVLPKFNSELYSSKEDYESKVELLEKSIGKISNLIDLPSFSNSLNTNLMETGSAISSPKFELDKFFSP